MIKKIYFILCIIFIINLTYALTDNNKVMYLKFEESGDNNYIDSYGNYKPMEYASWSSVNNVIINSSLYINNYKYSSQQIRIPLTKSVKDYSEGFEKDVYIPIENISKSFTIEFYVVLFDNDRIRYLTSISNNLFEIRFLNKNKISTKLLGTYKYNNSLNVTGEINFKLS